LFRSPDYGSWNYVDDRYVPRLASQWLLYPFLWALKPSTLVAEVPVRDARIALVLLAAITLLVLQLLGSKSRRLGAGLGWCVIWALCTYVLWLEQFSILRYISGLEVMSGVIIVAALHALALWRSPENLKVAAAGCLAVVLICSTVYPNWGRHPSLNAALADASMPALSPDSTVLVFGGTPSAYLAAFVPTSVRFVGVCNNLIYLKSRFGLQRQVEAAIRSAPGNIWALEKPDAFPDVEEQVMRRYNLRREGPCHDIASSALEGQRLCRLQRVGDPALPDPAKTNEFACPPRVPDWQPISPGPP